MTLPSSTPPRRVRPPSGSNTATHQLAGPPDQLLGIPVTPVTVQQLNSIAHYAVQHNDPVVIGHVNLHALSVARRSYGMRRFLETATLVQTDGMGVVLLSILLGGNVRPRHRVSFMEWVWPLLGLANEHGWKVFYLGSTPHVLSIGLEKIRQRYPRLQIAGHHGYFEAGFHSPDNRSVLNEIKGFGPDVLIVGMGMPRQESWVYENRSQLDAKVVLAAGAGMEWIAGTLRLAPRWISRVGAEWLFRLLTHPRRVWRRYLIEPWGLLPHAIRELAQRRLPLRPSRNTAEQQQR